MLYNWLVLAGVLVLGIAASASQVIEKKYNWQISTKPALVLRNISNWSFGIGLSLMGLGAFLYAL